MTEENLAKSITLIGPSGVGKSLLASELGKRLGYPVICIDDLIVFIKEEMKGYISPNLIDQVIFYKIGLKGLREEIKGSIFYKSKKILLKQKELVKEFVELYKYYVKLFNGLKPFYATIEKDGCITDNYGGNFDYIYGLALIATELLETALSLIDEPVIIDAPAQFGWGTSEMRLSDLLTKRLLKNEYEVNIEHSKKVVETITGATTTIFLYPGIDFKTRTEINEDGYDRTILSALNSYYTYADISITVNGIFNNPTNPYLKKRSWWDAREKIIKERLKNRAEISNICDEIIARVEELQMVHPNQII